MAVEQRVTCAGVVCCPRRARNNMLGNRCHGLSGVRSGQDVSSVSAGSQPYADADVRIVDTRALSVRRAATCAVVVSIFNDVVMLNDRGRR